MKVVASWSLAIVALIGGGVLVEALAAPSRATSPTSSGRQRSGAAPAESSMGSASCAAALIGGIGGLPVPSGAKFACSDGWALVIRGEGGQASFEVLDALGQPWTRSAGGTLTQLPYAPMLAAALGAPIPFVVLERLVADLPSAVPPEIAAAVKVVELAARDSTGSGGAYASSNVTYTASGDWLATAWWASGCSMALHRWSGSSWVLTGMVRGIPCHGPAGGSGPGTYGGGITTEQLTGSRDPDFAIHTEGADDNAFALVSDIGGTWHIVQFDQGYMPTTDIDFVAVRKGLVETVVDACGCAGGPYTFLWETYLNGAFVPTTPPGTPPSCTNAALENGGGTAVSLSGPAEPSSIVRRTRYVRISCADGWALGVGTRPGTDYQVVDLFNQDGGRWQTVTFDNGSDLGLDPAIYDLPSSLVLQLAGRLEPSLGPAAASSAVYTHLNPTASNNNWTLSGVMNADGSDWLLATEYQSNTPEPGPELVDVNIYRWSGSGWTEQGSVDRIHDESSDFFAVNSWYGVIPIPGSPAPKFKLTGTGSPPWTAVITLSSGTWHAVPG